MKAATGGATITTAAGIVTVTVEDIAEATAEIRKLKSAV